MQTITQQIANARTATGRYEGHWYRPSGKYQAIPPHIATQMWEVLCDYTPASTSVAFPARQVLLNAGFNKDQVGEFLSVVSSPDMQGDRLTKIAQGLYVWTFELRD